MNNKTKIIIIITLLVLSIGLIPTINIIFEFLVKFNDAVYSVLHESIFSFIFKHKITYYLVGLLLSSLSSFFGIKLGKEIGKLLYFILGFGVAGILNFILMLISWIVQ